jgi:hypothetical protein
MKELGKDFRAVPMTRLSTHPITGNDSIVDVEEVIRAAINDRGRGANHEEPDATLGSFFDVCGESFVGKSVRHPPPREMATDANSVSEPHTVDRDGTEKPGEACMWSATHDWV